MPAVDLTPNQQAAVEHFEGPLLVLAGPGSGKTRVITRRIARLVERGVAASQILAITFTNKAAREMAERVNTLLPESKVWVTTFHKFCARILRQYGGAIGLQPNFSIFDTSDQHQLLRLILHDLDIDATHFPPGKIAGQISQAKNDLVTADLFRQRYEERVGNHLQAIVAQVYPRYQQRMLEANAVDFDDLLLHVAGLLHEHAELRASLDARFRYILVDEYQDTNQAQYQIVAALSQQFPNLCATGDPDQSIYGWRGAQIENILRFERDFPEVKVIRLEENFRSTPEILEVADALIAHNRRRKAKVLRAVNESGPAVEFRLYTNGRSEADAIADEMRLLVTAGERKWSDFAIFYRVNALSRVLETALARARIPHQVAGSVAFFERSEVKDLLAYLRLIENPQDRIAFLRSVNTPPRGIGKTSVERLARWADEAQLSLLEAAARASQIPKMTKKAAKALQEFSALLERLSQRTSSSVADLLNQILAETGYSGGLQTKATEEEESQRLGNIHELLSAARQFDEQAERQPSDEPLLAAFLESASLAQDLDTLDSDLGAVTLMTLHSAKGLEFPHVYLIGVEQNLLPHERSLRTNNPAEIEEERRLLFVGITRAEQQLVLTQTLKREMHGRELSTIPSDFLEEMPLRVRDYSQSDFENFPDNDLPDEPPPQSAKALRQTDLRANFQLTTGAALQRGTGEAVSIPLGFQVGMTVRHPRYGLGEVVEVSAGFSRHRTITVEFSEDQRRESFIADKCPLQPIGR